MSNHLNSPYNIRKGNEGTTQHHSFPQLYSLSQSSSSTAADQDHSQLTSTHHQSQTYDQISQRSPATSYRFSHPPEPAAAFQGSPEFPCYPSDYQAHQAPCPQYQSRFPMGNHNPVVQYFSPYDSAPISGLSSERVGDSNSVSTMNHRRLLVSSLQQTSTETVISSPLQPSSASSFSEQSSVSACAVHLTSLRSVNQYPALDVSLERIGSIGDSPYASHGQIHMNSTDTARQQLENQHVMYSQLANHPDRLQQGTVSMATNLSVNLPDSKKPRLAAPGSVSSPVLFHQHLVKDPLSIPPHTTTRGVYAPVTHASVTTVSVDCVEGSFQTPKHQVTNQGRLPLPPLQLGIPPVQISRMGPSNWCHPAQPLSTHALQPFSWNSVTQGTSVRVRDLSHPVTHSNTTMTTSTQCIPAVFSRYTADQYNEHSVMFDKFRHSKPSTLKQNSYGKSQRTNSAADSTRQSVSHSKGTLPSSSLVAPRHSQYLGVQHNPAEMNSTFTKPTILSGIDHTSTEPSQPASSHFQDSSELTSIPSSIVPSLTSFQVVFGQLFSIRNKWDNFGLALGLSPCDVDAINTDNHGKCEPCLRETLITRIHVKPLTWRDVVFALRSPTIGNNELAEEIQYKFASYLDVPFQLDSSTELDSLQYSSAHCPGLSLPDCVVRYSSYLKDKYERMPVLPDSWPPPLVGQDHFTNLALIERRKYHILPQAKSKDSIEYDYAYGNVDNIVERKQAIKLENLFEPLPGEDSPQDQFIILIDGAPGVGKTTISRKICIDWSKDKLKSNFHFVILLPLREVLIDSESGSNISIADLLPADDPELKHQVLQYIQRTSGDGVLFIFDGFDELSFHQWTKHSLFLDIVKGKRLHKCSVLVTSRTYASGPLREISRINRHVEVLGFNKRQINDCIRKNITEKEKAKQLLAMLKERLDIISLCYIPLNCRIVLYVYQQQYTLPDTLTELYEVFILYTIKHYAEKISDEEAEEQIKRANSLDSLPPVIIEQLHILLETAYTGMIEDKLVFECNEIRQQKISLNFGLLNKIDLFRNDREKHYYQFLHFTLQEFLAAKYLSLQKRFPSEDKLKFLRSNVDADRFRITLLFLAGLTGLDFIPDKDVFSQMDLSQSPPTYLSPVYTYLKPFRTKFLFLAQLLYESKSETCEWLLSCLKSKVFDFSLRTLSQFDCLVLANFFSLTPKDHVWDSITLSNCSLKANQLKLLLCKLHTRTNVPIFNSTRTLNLVNPRSRAGRADNISFSWLLPLISGYSKVERIYVPQFIDSESSSCQLLIPSNVFTFKELVVGPGDGCVTDTELDLKGMSLYICPKLLSMLFKHLDPKKATIINLRDHPEVFQDCSRCDTFSSVIWKSLHGALGTFENMQELAITPLNTEHAFSLMNTFSVNKLVTDFSDSLISSEELINLRNHLARTPMTSIWFNGLKLSLENNAIFTIDIDPAIGDSQHCLGYLRTLLGEKLPHNFNNISVTCSFLIEDIGNWLEANSDLKELRVDLFSESVKSLSDEFSSALAQCVSHSATLEVLKIEYCELINNQLETISNSLLHTSSLKELHFQGILSTSNWSALFQAVKRNTSLCKLDCNTTTYSLYSESSRALCDMITNNTVLQELSINAQYIGEEYEMFVNTLLQSTTTRQVTVGRYYSKSIEFFKEELAKCGGDKIRVISQNCWTLGLVTLNFKGYSHSESFRREYYKLSQAKSKYSIECDYTYGNVDNM